MRDGHDGGRFLAPRFGCDTPEFLLQEAPLLGCGRPGTLGQSGAQPRIASGRVTALVLSRATIVSRTDSTPGADMSRRRELAHVRPNLRQHVRRTGLLQPRRRLHQLPFPLPSRLLDLGHDIRVPLPDLVFDESHGLQTVADHLPVVIAHPMPYQRRDNLRDLLLGAPLGKLGDLGRLGLALQQGIQHQLPRYSEYIGKNVAQFDVRVFQYLLYPVLLTRPSPPAVSSADASN